MTARPGEGQFAVFVSQNRFAVLNRKSQTIEIVNLRNTVVKVINPPIPTIAMFYGGRWSLILSSPDAVVLYDIRLSRVIGRLDDFSIKSAVWRKDGKLVALINKNSIIITNRMFTAFTRTNDRTPIKSGVWDDTGVFFYSTLTHIKYCLPQGDCGVICALDQPVYLAYMSNGFIHCLTRSGNIRSIAFNPAEYLFKLRLARNDSKGAIRILETSNLLGNGILAYAYRKGFRQVIFQFIQDKKGRFRLALELGQLELALELAKEGDDSDCWSMLAKEAMDQGSCKIAEQAYIQANDFEKLSLLHVVSGRRMKHVDDSLKPLEQKFLYSGDVISMGNFFEQDLGFLAHLTRRTYKVETATRKARPLPCSSDDNLIHTGLLSELPPLVAHMKVQNWPWIPEQPFSDTVRHNGVAKDHVEDIVYSSESEEEDNESEDEDWESAEENIYTIFWLGPQKGKKDASFSSRNRDARVDPQSHSLEFAVTHILNGSIKPAMQILYDKFGVRNFEMIRANFLCTYWASRIYLSFVGSTLPLQFKVDHHIIQPPFAKGSPLRESIQSMLDEGYGLYKKHHFEQAKTCFRWVLRALLLTKISSKSEAKEWRDIRVTAREYLIATFIRIKLQHIIKNDPKNMRRKLELAAYLTHCRLQPSDLDSAFATALNYFTSSDNHAHVSYLTARLLQVFPERARSEIHRYTASQAGSPKLTNHVQISYIPTSPFELCATSYVPIYGGSTLVRCPYIGAAYLPQYKGKLDPLMELTEIGATIDHRPFQ